MMSLKYRLIIVSIAGLVCVGTYGFHRARDIAGADRKLADPDILRTYTIDVGVVPMNSVVRYGLTLHNPRKSPLVVSWLGSDCDCVTSTQSTTIAAQSDGVVDLKIFTKGYRGKIVKRIVLGVDLDPVQVLVNLNAEVGHVVVESSQLNLGEIPAGATRNVVIDLFHLHGWSEPDVALTSQDQDISVPSVSHPDDDKVNITVKAPPVSGRFVVPLRIVAQHSLLPANLEVDGEIQFTVTNDLFQQEELFVGSAKVGAERQLKAIFKLKRAILPSERLWFDADAQATWYQVVKEGDHRDDHPEVVVSVITGQSWPSGTRKIYAHWQNASGAVIAIPFIVYILA